MAWVCRVYKVGYQFNLDFLAFVLILLLLFGEHHDIAPNKNLCHQFYCRQNYTIHFG